MKVRFVFHSIPFSSAHQVIYGTTYSLNTLSAAASLTAFPLLISTKTALVTSCQESAVMNAPCQCVETEWRVSRAGLSTSTLLHYTQGFFT